VRGGWRGRSWVGALLVSMGAGGLLATTGCGFGLVSDPLRLQEGDTPDSSSDQLGRITDGAREDVPETTRDGGTNDGPVHDVADDVPSFVGDASTADAAIHDVGASDVATLVGDASTPDIPEAARDHDPDQDAGPADVPPADADPAILGAHQSGIVLAGGAGWSGVEVARSNGDGTFRTTHVEAADLARLAASPGVTLLSGDFDGDGSWDLALIQGPDSTDPPWNGIPIAFARRGGSYELGSRIVLDFPDFARQLGAKAVSGDFDHDGKWDVALTGGWVDPVHPWNTLPVAFSNGDGSFRVTNREVVTIPDSSTQTGATPVAGDFNGDGKQDIALVGGSLNGAPWLSLPVAFSNGDGSFVVTNLWAADFPLITSLPGAKAVTGDFNGDGLWDIAATGGTSPDGSLWNTLPVALSYGDGTFLVLNLPLASFPALASASGARPVTGDFDGDGRSDVALVGGHGPGGDPWTSIPVAFSFGDGSFRSANLEVGDFSVSAATPGVQAASLR